MMYQNKSNRRMMLKALFAVSVATLSISAFAMPKAVKDFDKTVSEIDKKEKEVLEMDCWRALTELNAKAKDFEEMKKVVKS